MLLHAPALEVLHGIGMRAVLRIAGEQLIRRLADRVAEALQAAVVEPVAEKDPTQAMAGLREVAAIRRRRAHAREGLPWPALQLQQLRAQPPGQHADRTMILQAVTLEPLRWPSPALVGLDSQLFDRVAEDRQATVALPVV